MFSTSDTIVAIATPPGRGGIGVVRLSGASALHVAGDLLDLRSALQPRHATFARVNGDHVVATYFPAPHSYTGEDVVELSAHGSPVVLRQIVEDAIHRGARLAEPGEFTLRAFLNGRIDLIQAEAVADLIDSVTPLQARAAFDQLEGTLTERITNICDELFDAIARMEASLDFPDEGYHFIDPSEAAVLLRGLERRLAALLCDARLGRLIREGARVTIVGRPNVGKSSLFNALVRSGRAIVTPLPGTTRDVLTETVDVDGLKLDLVDTAGIRETVDQIEREGVARARKAWTTADLVIVVLDGSEPLQGEDLDVLCETSAMRRLVAINKSDLAAAWDHADLRLESAPAAVSSKTHAGVNALRQYIREMLEGNSSTTPRDTAAITNVRHAALVERARGSLRRACESLEDPGGPVPEEFVLTDLQDARGALEEVTGKRTSDDLLHHIFSRFCIGK